MSELYAYHNLKTEHSDVVIKREIKYFPIPCAIYHPGMTVNYADSWKMRRTYGGERVHEGCDIMADVDKRGHYPVISMSDGTIEKMGWLKLGGYRIGIRSDNGTYYYYAHLSDYADSIKPGMSIVAGELLGYMGDTGYSEDEGTTGNFPVHLHVGIYIPNRQGTEESVDPYPYLLSVDSDRIYYDYE